MTIGLTWRRTARRIKRLKEAVLTISPDYSDRQTPDFLALSYLENKFAAVISYGLTAELLAETQIFASTTNLQHCPFARTLLILLATHRLTPRLGAVGATSAAVSLYVLHKLNSTS